ncbi:MAG: Uma2 family endonuclease [Myxococcota bacterium]
MAVAGYSSQMTYAEYLAFEGVSAEKHEFINGEPHAMSEGTPVHARLQVRLGGRLDAALEGRRCASYGPDLRIYFAELDEGAYADASVLCGPLVPAPGDPNAATNPTVICEVLSPSTEAYDRGRKFEKYRALPTVKEYVLVAQDRALVEVFRRDADSTWTLRTYGPGARVELASIDVHIAVDDLYRGVLDVPEGG